MAGTRDSTKRIVATRGAGDPRVEPAVPRAAPSGVVTRTVSRATSIHTRPTDPSFESVGWVSSAVAALLRTLTKHLEDDRRASVLLGRAVAESRSAVPRDVINLLAFAHARLSPLLAPELGPRGMVAFFEDLESALLGVTSGESYASVRARSDVAPQPARAPVGQPLRAHARSRWRPSVVLLDHDRFRRAALARWLVNGGCDVEACDDVQQVDAALRSGRPFDAVVAAAAEYGTLRRVVVDAARSRPGTKVIILSPEGDAVLRHVWRAATDGTESCSPDQPQRLVRRLHEIVEDSDR